MLLQSGGYLELYTSLLSTLGSSLFLEYPENDPVMKTLKEYEEREARKWRTKSKLAKAEHLANGSKVMNVGGDDGDDDEDAGNGKFVGPVLAPLHVRVKPVDAREVSLHKLTIEEIMSIRKFSNYEVGAPSKVCSFSVLRSFGRGVR